VRKRVTASFDAAAEDWSDLDAIARELAYERDGPARKILAEWLHPRRVVAFRQRNRLAQQALKTATFRAAVVGRWLKFRRRRGAGASPKPSPPTDSSPG
jgi:hypothetical protein